MRSKNFLIVGAFIAAACISAIGQTLGPAPGSSGGTPGGSSGQIQYNNAGSFDGFTLGGDCTFSVPNITCVLLNGVPTGTAGNAIAKTNGSNIWSALQTYTGGELNSTAGAASAPAKTFTGTPFAGTGTTSFPLMYFNIGTAPTTFGTGGTFFGINAALANAANLMDFHINGGNSVFKVDQAGNLTLGNGTITISAAGNYSTTTGNYTAPAGGLFAWTGRGLISSPAVGTIQLGNADAAAPVLQTLQAQSVSTGTSNVAGQELDIIGSLSTGSGVSGNVVIGTGGTGAGATTKNSAVAALTVRGATQYIQFSKTYTVAQLATCNAGLANSWTVVNDAAAPTYAGVLVGLGAVTVPVFCDGVAWKSH